MEGIGYVDLVKNRALFLVGIVLVRAEEIFGSVHARSELLSFNSRDFGRPESRGRDVVAFKRS